jgi:L-lactate dehydrogenase complex protein LldG
MSSREDILNRVRARLGRTAQNLEAARSSLSESLQRPIEGPRPPVGLDLAAEFRRRSVALSSTVDAVAAMDHVPVAVASYLREHGLPLQAVCVPALAGMDWTGAGLRVEARGARDEDLVGITGCFCAIAETGTLMLCSAPESPATVSLLPETHVAVVPVGRIVAGMEEAWKLARAELGELPRAVNFVSGPSRTGDIEQTIVLGAHGPYRVHIVLVDRA